MSSFKWLANSLKSLRIQGAPATGHIQQARSPHEKPTPQGQKTTTVKPLVPEAPKKPLSPYIRFVSAIRPEVATANPGKSPTDVMRLVAERWAQLDASQKEKYSKGYKSDVETWKAVTAKFKASLTPIQQQLLEKEKSDKNLRREKIERKKKLKELEKPKRPVSSFFRFALSKRKDGDGYSTQENMEHVKNSALLWKVMSDEQKAPFVQGFNKDMESYQRAMIKWEEKMIRMGNEELVRKRPSKHEV